MKQRCETAHARDYVVGHEAAWDLGRYMRFGNIPGRVRYICDDCARGFYLGKKARRIAPEPEPCGVPIEASVEDGHWVIDRCNKPAVFDGRCAEHAA